MKIRQHCLLGLLLLAQASQAQLRVDPDWKESDAPPAPAFSTTQLIPIDMPRYVTLRFGVDPQTLSVSADGIVRYVMVATSASGTINAMYESLRCSTGEVKTLARFSSAGQWNTVTDPQWQPLNDTLRSRHALALARQGACQGRTAGPDVRTIVYALKHPNTGLYDQ